jgi:uracil-DNA glycosylase family 4
MSNLNWDLLNEKIMNCRLCPRLVAWRESIASQKRKMYLNWKYWGKPVPGFGDTGARLVVIGMAPGAHGSNRTGRMFTGDASGEFLYDALYRHGFANQPQSVKDGDGLQLMDMFITAVCRCAPPGNKPFTEEIGNCLPFLDNELDLISHCQGIIALGQIAYSYALKLTKTRYGGLTGKDVKFSHGTLVTPIDESAPWILASYHPSRQNTQTGRLTKTMFDEIWLKAKQMLAR